MKRIDNLKCFYLKSMVNLMQAKQYFSKVAFAYNTHCLYNQNIVVNDQVADYGILSQFK